MKSCITVYLARSLKYSLLATVLMLPRIEQAAQSIAVPFPGADSVASSEEPFALQYLPGQPPTSRYQQVYDASAFSLLGGGGGTISEIDLRSDFVFGHGYGALFPSVEIFMTVTARGPDGLSSTFADNLGSNPFIAYSRGPLELVADGPGAFVHIPLQNPFFYDPAAGNLLIEIRNYERTTFPGIPQANAGPFDAYNILGDQISRVYANDVNATTGTADTLGLTTFFIVTPVPEPSTITLFALGIAVFGVCLHRRKHTATDIG